MCSNNILNVQETTTILNVYTKKGWKRIECTKYISIALRAILNKSRRQHPTKQQLNGHLSSITKTIEVRRTRHAGQSWRSRDKLICDVLLWNSSHGRAKAGRPARTYIRDTGCSPEDMPEAMNDWKEWKERVRDIRAGGTTRWYIYIYIYIYIQFSLNIIDIFCLHIFLLILSYCCIYFKVFSGNSLIYFSIIIYFPSSFCPTLGHHQGRVYKKSDVTFVCKLLLCKKKSIWSVAVCSVYF